MDAREKPEQRGSPPRMQEAQDPLTTPCEMGQADYPVVAIKDATDRLPQIPLPWSEMEDETTRGVLVEEARAHLAGYEDMLGNLAQEVVSEETHSSRGSFKNFLQVTQSSCLSSLPNATRMIGLLTTPGPRQTLGPRRDKQAG